MNTAWEILVDKEPLKRGSMLLKYCKTLVVIEVIGVVVLLAGAGGLVKRAHTSPEVFGFTSDHRSITGSPKPLSTTTDRFAALATDIINASLTRNEKGLLPELGDFVTPGALVQLERGILQFKPQTKMGFSQEFVVDPNGLQVVSGNAMEARCMVRGIMTSSTPENVAKSKHYWGVQFLHIKPTDKNPLGWRLNDIFPITENQFYATEEAKLTSDAVKTSK